MIGINSLPAVNHQPEFSAHCVTPEADKALADGAIAMAWTCIDLATNRDVQERLITRKWASVDAPGGPESFHET